MKNKKEYQHAYYLGFFHDGELIDIQHNDKMKIQIRSSTLLPEDNINEILLNEEGQVCGTILLSKIKSINVITELGTCQHLELRDPDGKILDLDFLNGTLVLNIRWTDLATREYPDVISLARIEAESIIWRDELNDIEIDVTHLRTEEN